MTLVLHDVGTRDVLQVAAFFGRPLPGVIHRTGPIPKLSAVGRQSSVEKPRAER